MFEASKLLWIYAEHPVHAGAGDGVGAIDLPIQRERVTNWPIIQPSGLKGALREHFEAMARLEDENAKADFKTKVTEVFGPDKNAEFAGALSLTEAKVLLFPVQSLKGTFAYVTCPLALKRLERDLATLKDCGGTDLLFRENKCSHPFPTLTEAPEFDNVWIKPEEKSSGDLVPDSVLIAGTVDEGKKVIFEELAFNAVTHQAVTQLADWLTDVAGALPWLDSCNSIAQRLVIVADDVFKDFVEMSTEVITRNRIDDATGTVMKGGLWTEEHLPRETVLYSLLFAAKPFRASSLLDNAAAVFEFIQTEKYNPTYLWVGGNTTVGKGLVRLAFK